MPNDKDGNKIQVKNLYARTKITCNNNSSHHLDLNNDGYDNNYFGTIRNGGHIPAMFEKHFDENKKCNNIVGFYTDSNTGQIDSIGNKDDRARPTFEIRANYTPITGYFQPAPFWNNIFDYGKYNHLIATEFNGVNNVNQIRTETVLHPWNAGPSNLTVTKKPRQGAYDNIHLHGYFGNYAIDGQPVIHAPICGYCCFHMHWRWSALNDAIVNSPFIAMGTGNFSRAFQRIFMSDISKIKAYLGWGKPSKSTSQEMPYTTKGAPLIPSDQTLNIAVTPHSFIPETQTAEVVSESSGISLSETEKTIWYSVKIENEFGAHGAHLSMEQGCGYAFRYSALGKYMKNISNCAFPKDFRKVLSDPNNGIPGNFDSTFLDYVYNEQTKETALEAAEYFEMQYRFMKFFNQNLDGIDKTNINQVPAVNLGASSADPNNSSNYGDILQAFEDL